jgi:hypothetical protein
MVGAARQVHKKGKKLGDPLRIVQPSGVKKISPS